MIHSILIIGQSNMAGRGFFGEVPPIENKRIKVLRNGRWLGMFTPVNPDRSFSGVNLVESFADAYSKDHDVDVGIIPCADGGTCLDQWQVGGLLYDHAVMQAKLALRTSNIAAVLWHQGESDCTEDRNPLYEAKFTKIMNQLREDLDLHDVPFLLGGLGDFLANYQTDKFLDYPKVNEALKTIAAKNPMTGFVSAEGLGANPDNLHFSAASLREFGIRYYEKFTELEDKNRVFPEKSEMDAAIRSALELL